MPIPAGGFKEGDSLYYCGESETFDDGDKLEFGAKGVVTQARVPLPGTREGGVAVRFPGNRAAMGCLVTQLSRTPPLPGGFLEGEFS